MSAPASTSESTNGVATTSASSQDTNKVVPQLGALEEDDEFEEFAEQDWNPSETSLAHLMSTTGSSDSAPTTTSNLWEDNWDDDDVEEDFSKQLRAELEKQANEPTAMST
ncbi:Uncharacterized conserved protein [Phaffia rhodozyma]|uniref:26S proteasome complex subunit SEM1 n=1 Tax=Phaffia rhodozyma TaxID=264483 RepID=A0A0F7SSK9_PHARH|nr:Uncharacterized conserved protein [Phaffia rhodozyma]